MKNPPGKCLIDTNVPINANLATDPASSSDIPDECIEECINAVEHIVKKGGLVLDEGWEILGEYSAHLSSGQPGQGHLFFKWVITNRDNPQKVDRIKITKKGASYDEFPDHDGLAKFDISDRKFIAVAHAHPDKPPILQATDSKWWGCKDALTEVGITVDFLCPDYVKKKHAKKMSK